jgi:vancomycin resistance protein YoaR
VTDRNGHPAFRPADDGATGNPLDDPTVRISTSQLETPPDAAPAPRRRSAGVIAAVASAAVILVLAIAYLVDLLSTSGEIERNTTVAGVQVGGMTPQQATAALTAQALPAYSAPVTVDVHGENTSIDPEQAGLNADVNATVAGLGIRSANPLSRIGSFFGSIDVPLRVVTDEAALRSYLATVAEDTDTQPVEGAVSIVGAEVRTVQPVVGRTLDVDAAAAQVAQAWSAGGPPALKGLVLPVVNSAVRATPEKVQAASAQAKELLSGPIRLVAEGKTATIPVATIAAATTVAPDDADGFRVTLDAAAVRAEATSAVEATQAGPVDATITIQNNAPVITPSRAGQAVDWTATDAAITAAAGTDKRDVKVVYTTAQPSFTTEKAKALGIKEVIGEFTTGGFAEASGVNIRVVAEKVNGAIIQPGATFGLNEFTGPRGAEQGYVEAAIIQEGALSKAVGGGISQFATTLYNAAYFAGMGDVTHTPHSFYISRYPPGREATVFDGEIELAFSNDYPTGVLIQTIWTDSDITVRLWGTKHVNVESVTGERFDSTPPQRIVKPAGPECIPSEGTEGFSINDTRIIRDLTGKEIKRETFTTVYNGQQNVVCSSTEPPTPTGSGTT